MADKSPQETIRELKELVVAYFRQEALDPLRSLGRYVGFGLAGGTLLGVGVVCLAIGALRALQSETGDALTNNWSWLPYVIVAVVLLVAGALAWKLRGERSEP